MPFAIPCLVVGPPLMAGIPPAHMLPEVPIAATFAWFALLATALLSAAVLAILAQPQRHQRHLRLVHSTGTRPRAYGITR